MGAEADHSLTLWPKQRKSQESTQEPLSTDPTHRCRPREEGQATGKSGGATRTSTGRLCCDAHQDHFTAPRRKKKLRGAAFSTQCAAMWATAAPAVGRRRMRSNAVTSSNFWSSPAVVSATSKRAFAGLHLAPSARAASMPSVGNPRPPKRLTGNAPPITFAGCPCPSRDPGRQCLGTIGPISQPPRATSFVPQPRPTAARLPRTDAVASPDNWLSDFTAFAARIYDLRFNRGSKPHVCDKRDSARAGNCGR